MRIWTVHAEVMLGNSEQKMYVCLEYRGGTLSQAEASAVQDLKKYIPYADFDIFQITSEDEAE